MVFALGAFAVPISHAQTAEVERVSATDGDGFYKAGATVSITVEFTEAVTVTTSNNTAILLVQYNRNGSAAAGNALYVSGSGTTSLIFTFTVESNSETRKLFYPNRFALLLDSGAAISTGAGSATLTLPPVGSANSLSGTSTVVLDTIAPEFPAPGDATTNSDPLDLTIAIGSTTATVVYNAEATDYAGTADTGITYTLGGTGTDPDSFSLDTLGVLTPAATESSEATYTLTLTATDQAGNVGTQYLRVEVLPATPTFRTTILDQSYPAEMTIETLTLPPAFGGTGTLSYTLMPDASCLGLSFDPVNRTLSGMPTTPTVATALTYTVSDGVTPTPNTAALTFSVTITAAPPPPPEPQTVSADFALKPSEDFAAGGTFRLLFVTTQTTVATSADIDTYNSFVQDQRGCRSILPFRASASAANSARSSPPQSVDARDQHRHQ